MNINSVSAKIENKRTAKPQPNFGNGIDTVLRFLDTNKAWGAVGVDVGSMVIPRTAVDFSRGIDAGLETGGRESSSSLNHASVGLYGAGAGALIATAFNPKYGVKFNKIFAGDKLLDNFGEAWSENKELRPFLEHVVDSIEGFNPSNVNATAEGWVGIPKDTQKIIVDRLEKEIRESGEFKINKETEKFIHNIITSTTGAEAEIRLKGIKTAVDGLELKNVLENIYSVSKTFLQEKVVENPTEFLKSMKRFNKYRSLAGLGIASAIGMSIQPINRYLTKKRTGSDDFVGGGEKDNSTRFKVTKVLAAVAFLIGAFATISTKPAEILSKIQYKGMVPTLDQFKAVYGLTICSRFLSARNGNELGESARKDTLGFISWLLLGNVVAKGVAKWLDKDLINYHPGKGILKANIKTRDEVLLEALRGHGISVVENGKALKFSELIKKLPKADKITRRKLWKLNGAQFAGYLFSGLILGFGIPKMNKYITNNKEAKKKAALEAQAEAAKNVMLKPEAEEVANAA
ncbi:hypothetical protein J6S88_04410 [bacterium]|nr:hypothetical protein [bacterium]